ncbi:hypothetical protein LY76DRAFT_664007 [Colletotrichum caudatum]|nr:hypothetical protein LY76DRAFT_664007 [Colletotrichum caudatum]
MAAEPPHGLARGPSRESLSRVPLYGYTRKMREFEILIFVYFFVATCCAAALEPQLLHARNPGTPKLAIVSTPLNEKGEVNPYFCDAEKTAAIQNAHLDFLANATLVTQLHSSAGLATRIETLRLIQN